MKLIYSFLVLSLCLTACSEAPVQEETSQVNEVEENTSENTLQKEPASIPNPLKSGEYYFSGAINHKYPFHMHLTVEGDQLSGAYYYHSQKKEIELKGEVKNGQLIMDELYNSKITGNFTSSVCTSDSIEGIWKSPKGKQLEFALTSTSKGTYHHFMESSKKNWSADQFKAFLNKFPKMNKLPFTLAPVVETSGDNAFELDDIRTFTHEDYNPEEDYAYQYHYGVKYETEQYIATFHHESFVPGAFGIFNYYIVMRTYTLEGTLIDEEYVACNCTDNNYMDYYVDQEELSFDGAEVKVTGTSTHASHEWAEEEGEEVFEKTVNTSKSFMVTSEGIIEK